MTYRQEQTKLANNNQATLLEMQIFLTMWNCICGTCVVCNACLEVVRLIKEKEQ